MAVSVFADDHREFLIATALLKFEPGYMADHNGRLGAVHDQPTALRFAVAVLVEVFVREFYRSGRDRSGG